jgi:hypothetical protein
MGQELWSLEVGEGVSSAQIKLAGQFWIFRPVPNEIWKDSDHEDPRKFYILSNEG